MKVTELQAAFVLHSRPYRETSSLLKLFTEHHGCIDAIARGLRSPTSKKKALLQAFTPLWITWSGKGSLVTLSNIEPAGGPVHLHGNALLCAFYLNELLMRLCAHPDPYPQLFHYYRHALARLQFESDAQICLRQFELQLLTQLGYGICFTHDTAGELIEADAHYHFYAKLGFHRIDSSASRSAQDIFKGDVVAGIASEMFDQAPVLSGAKRLTRIALANLLGNKPLMSRTLLTPTKTAVLIE